MKVGSFERVAIMSTGRASSRIVDMIATRFFVLTGGSPFTKIFKRVADWPRQCRFW